MKQLTNDIKIKIKEEAKKILQNGDINLIVNENELNIYSKMLEEAWVNSEISFSWEIQ